MKRLPVFWVSAPDEQETDDFERSITFRVTDDWLAVDSDQLILPITLIERDGEQLDEPEPGLLKQYGGEMLLNDLLLAEQDLEAGTRWLLGHQEGRGRYITPLSD